MKPSSFCSLSTFNSHKELYGLLLSLSIYHENATVFCFVDMSTKRSIENYVVKPKLNIHWNTCLDKYSNLSRSQMVARKIWSDFQMEKANVINFALNTCNDTLFLDADQIVVGEINDIDITKQLGVSPHYVNDYVTSRVGYYNGGMLWAQNKNIPLDWIEFTKTSRYFDQASIEDLVKKYSYFEFGQNYNFGEFRLSHNNHKWDLKSKGTQLYLEELELKTVHTHLHKGYRLNKIIKSLLQTAQNNKLLDVIKNITDPI